MLSWSGFVNGRRVTVHRSDLVELLGLITCQVRGIGQVAKLPGARAEMRLTRAFGPGTVRQEMCRRERGVEVTVRENQKRRMKHEKGEGEMGRCDMRTANTLSHACTPRKEKMQRKCACDTECVCTLPVTHTVVATTWVRNPETKKKSSDFVIPCQSGFLPPRRGPPICFPPIIISECFSVSRSMLFC